MSRPPSVLARFTSAGALALVTTLACACGEDRQFASRGVNVSDGGYALVAVTVTGGDDAEIEVALDDGVEIGDGHALFREDGEPPFHTGWFDISPWFAECEKSPRSAACLDVHGQMAGAFVGVARHGTARSRVRDTVRCGRDSEEVCIYYYAIVAEQRGAHRTAWIRVATTSHAPEAAEIDPIR